MEEKDGRRLVLLESDSFFALRRMVVQFHQDRTERNGATGRVLFPMSSGINLKHPAIQFFTFTQSRKRPGMPQTFSRVQSLKGTEPLESGPERVHFESSLAISSILFCERVDAADPFPYTLLS